MFKNNKGFTVVEMGISFCLIFTICILLFQVILSLKEIYVSSDIETTLLNKQGIVLNKMYKDFEKKGVSLVEECGTNCIRFTYNDGSIADLVVDTSNKKITYDSYIWTLDNASTISNLTFITGTIEGYGNYFNIKVPVSNKLIQSKDFGLDVVYNLPSST